jgi:hypothetical protein
MFPSKTPPDKHAVIKQALGVDGSMILLRLRMAA